MVTPRQIDLKRLRYFTAVAEVGSFSKAALRLHIAQPALSRQVRLLEDDLGLQLLTRSARGVALTEAGRILLDHAHGLAANLARIVEDMHSRAGSPKGHVTVGLPPSTSSLLAPLLVRRVHRDFPGVTLKVMDGLSFVLANWLENGTIDLAILGFPFESPVLRLEVVAVEDIVVVEKPGTPSPPATYSAPALSAKPLILSELFETIVRTSLRMPKLEFNPILQIDAVEAIRRLVLDGFGATILPVSMFIDEIRTGQVACSGITSRGVKRTLTLARPSMRQGTLAIDAVAQALKDELAALERDGTFSLATYPRSRRRTTPAVPPAA